jgi:hypothetical protein
MSKWRQENPAKCLWNGLPIRRITDGNIKVRLLVLGPFGNRKSNLSEELWSVTILSIPQTTGWDSAETAAGRLESPRPFGGRYDGSS